MAMWIASFSLKRGTMFKEEASNVDSQPRAKDGKQDGSLILPRRAVEVYPFQRVSCSVETTNS